VKRVAHRPHHASQVFSKACGCFLRWSVTAQLPEDGFEDGSGQVGVDVASIDASKADCDDHLRGAGCFNVAAFPTMPSRSSLSERYAGLWRL
jgi:polyisoprenoid-binding protein YceI